MTMSPAAEGLERVLRTVLASESSVTPEKIREVITNLRQAPIFVVSDEEAEFIARRLEVQQGVTMSLGSVLTERGYAPWLDSARAQLTFYYWDRYRSLLEQRGLSSQVLATIHADTDRTLGLLENPLKPGPWSRRGMVVGHVQSGKTGNYIGLICKAADAGYRLIVVIAGVHNNLRNQTQKRIDEGFVGRDSARLLSRREERFIGVGRFDAQRRPVTFTNSVKDFSKEMATGVGVPLQNLNEPAVFVIKKNSSTLRNLLEWIREHNASRGGTTVDAPMLLIDDEADNASINVRYGQGEVTRINGQIRELLQLFSRSCYVGYTATPFANIFIDPDTDDEMRGADLFPRHFIVSLDPPTNYFGPDRVFGSDSRAVVRHIEDSEQYIPIKHRIDFPVTQLPPSLIEAVRVFIVGRAIRLLRGHQLSHSSMLVNASRFTGVQSQIASRINDLVLGIVASVRVNGALPGDRALLDPELGALHAAWEREFGHLEIEWRDVQTQLLNAAAPIRVVEVNSRSAGTLNYDEYADSGLTVIAVGGYSLSRGLTLEGLMVSYFLRNSMMYDTLMQMGRWFGYRPQYEDLCRVWLPEEAEGWYVHITESIEMLREEFRRMSAANATPEEFGLKVRAHPDTLIVTAKNKMGAGERVVVNIGLSNEFIETSTLRNDDDSLEANRLALQHLVRSLRELGHPIANAERLGGSLLLRAVPVSPVRTFLAAFSNHPLSVYTDPLPVGRYIDARQDAELAAWDILFAGVSNDRLREPDRSLGIDIVPQTREAGTRSDESTLRIGNKQRVSSRGIERFGLSAADVATAEAEYRNRPGATGRAENYPDWIYRARRPRPLLVIHLLRINSDRAYLNHEHPVVAWSLSLPRSSREEQRVEYVVTRTWLRENFRDEDADDEELASDDT